MYQRGASISSNLILFLFSYFLLKMVPVMNEPHCHEIVTGLTKLTGNQKYIIPENNLLQVTKYSASKKLLPMLLRKNLPQNIYNLQYLGAPKAFRRFLENILGRVILVYNCYFEQSVCNLAKT